MYESREDLASGSIAPSAAEILDWLERLADVDQGESEADCIDRLNALERLKSAAAAAQARVTGDLEARRDPERRRRTNPGLGNEIALARQESPHQGRAHLALSRALLHDLPCTLAALTRGDISERRAQIIATETVDLCAADRRLVDAEIADRLPGLGDGDVQQAARRAALRLDEESALRRRRRAHAGRHVSGRVLRDGSAQVTAVVSDVHYAAIVASLSEAAASARAAGDDRTRAQVMADLFVSRLTGQVTAQATPVAVKLVVSAETLLGDSSEPAQVYGAGVVPASVARQMVGAAAEVRSTIQQLFRFPETGTLVAMERGVRRFPAALREFIALRDQRCRTPWCNAPIQHTDHPVPARDGGATSVPNGQGLCEACNYAKEAYGWSQRPVGEDFDAHTVEITTPTGHVHRSREPGLPFPPSLPRPRTRLEAAFCDLILTV
jgi:hypothetical protein